MNVKLIATTQGQGELAGKSLEEISVSIARVSSSRKDKLDDPIPLLNHCIKNNHWSVFEHASITMEIATSKAIGIQLLRHRSFTFQEFSQRYARVTDIEPIEIRKRAVTNRQSSTNVFNPTIKTESYLGGYAPGSIAATDLIEGHIEQTKDLYNKLINAGVAKECARMVLPMATSTTIYMTGTIRSWIHLIDIRDDGHAQKEIQLIAKEMKAILIEQCPIISKARGWINDELIID